MCFYLDYMLLVLCDWVIRQNAKMFLNYTKNIILGLGDFMLKTCFVSLFEAFHIYRMCYTNKRTYKINVGFK